SQSEEMFGAMRLLGKTVELVRFPEESHDISRGGRPDRRVERLRRIARWFERFLGTSASDRTTAAEAPAVAARAAVTEANTDTQTLVTRDLAAGHNLEETVQAWAVADMAVAEPRAVESEFDSDSEAVVLVPEVEPFDAVPKAAPKAQAFGGEPEPAVGAQATARAEATPASDWQATARPVAEQAAVEEAPPVFPEPEPLFPEPESVAPEEQPAAHEPERLWQEPVAPEPAEAEPQPVATATEPVVPAAEPAPEPAPAAPEPEPLFPEPVEVAATA